MSDALRLAEALIACPSVTPDDAGCQRLVAERLTAAGYACEALDAGPDGGRVANLWAVHRGARPGPTVVLAGHTDVVPPGPLDRWTSHPFVPTHRDGRLHGRGAADMKGAVAAMVVAAERYAAADAAHAGSVALLLTSDEEGPARHGTAHAVAVLRERGVRLDACLIGEPTSEQRVGDTAKNGRRGTLSLRLVVHGVQGHVAYPQLAKNPVHMLAPALAELVATRWDDGDAQFPPTTFQVSNVHAGTGAGNVIPGDCVVDANFRFGPASTAASLRERIAATLARHGVDPDIDWTLGGEPFLSPPGPLHTALCAAVEAAFGVVPRLATNGGTSDGRLIAPHCPQVLEFGVVNASAHQVDEWVDAAALAPLADVYHGTLAALLA